MVQPFILLFVRHTSHIWTIIQSNNTNHDLIPSILNRQSYRNANVVVDDLSSQMESNPIPHRL